MAVIPPREELTISGHGESVPRAARHLSLVWFDFVRNGLVWSSNVTRRGPTGGYAKGKTRRNGLLSASRAAAFMLTLFIYVFPTQRKKSLPRRLVMFGSKNVLPTHISDPRVPHLGRRIKLLSTKKSQQRLIPPRHPQVSTPRRHSPSIRW